MARMMPSSVLWVGEHAVARHRDQADDACRRFLGAADDLGELLGEARVQRGVEVGAVVHDDVRVGRDDRLDMLIVRVRILTGDGVDFDAVIADERSRGVILR